MKYITDGLMICGLVLLLFHSGADRVQAQTDNQAVQRGATVESRYGETYDAQLALQDSWIDGLSVVEARDYGADLMVSGAVVSTFGSLATWSFSAAFDAGIANFEPGNATTVTYIGFATLAAIGVFGLTMMVVGAVDIIMADQILLDSR